MFDSKVKNFFINPQKVYCTVNVIVAVLPLVVVAVMMTSPVVLPAFTSPVFSDTVATLSSLDVHVTTLSSSAMVVGEMVAVNVNFSPAESDVLAGVTIVMLLGIG
jgi:hypothetical protein